MNRYVRERQERRARDVEGLRAALTPERRLVEMFRGLSLVGQATVLASTEALLFDEARSRRAGCSDDASQPAASDRTENGR